MNDAFLQQRPTHARAGSFDAYSDLLGPHKVVFDQRFGTNLCSVALTTEIAAAGYGIQDLAVSIDIVAITHLGSLLFFVGLLTVAF